MHGAPSCTHRSERGAKCRSDHGRAIAVLLGPPSLLEEWRWQCVHASRTDFNGTVTSESNVTPSHEPRALSSKGAVKR